MKGGQAYLLSSVCFRQKISGLNGIWVGLEGSHMEVAMALCRIMCAGKLPLGEMRSTCSQQGSYMYLRPWVNCGFV